MDNPNMHTEATETDTINTKIMGGKHILPELYLHEPSSDRFQDFITNSQKVQKLLFGTSDYQPNIMKRTFTEKLTKNPEEGNMEAIKELICQDNGAKSLIIAPTGSGKTYSIDAIFKQITAESSEKQLLCLLCPNRVQNIQNEKSDDYNFEALIEGISLEDNGEDIRQISAVYDKLPEIRKYKKEHPDCKLRVVIDECHTLISANTFREQAISSIMRLIQSGEADSYTFITATYENMCVFSFNNILLFEDKNYKPVFKSIDIRFAKKKDLDNLIMSTAMHESKPYIRLNSMERIERIDKTLTNLGINSQTITADDKGYRTNDDGTVTYNNIIFDHIVNNDDLYNNKGEADVILATSLLDAGTNFSRYSPESTPVFVVLSEKLMNIDEIEQSFNRFRPQKDKDGNIIQLDHAIILHQIPDHDITRIRIAKHDSEGNSWIIENAPYIPPKAVSYTDKTTPEQKQQGYHNGMLTIPGKYFESLESGKYILEFTFGNSNTVLSNNLYVNCKQDIDIDTLQSLMDTARTNEREWMADESNTAALITGMDARIDSIAALDPSFSFTYNTGDEVVSGRIILRPYKWFYDLAYILENCVQQINEHKGCFYGYYNIKRKSINSNIFHKVGGMTEKELLENVLKMVQDDDESGISQAMSITNSLHLWIDYYKLFNTAYTIYQKQYFYYPERLADELQRRLNIPVSISYHTPESYKIEKTEKEDRKSLLDNLNTLYNNPLTKEIVKDVLHKKKKIPLSLEEGQRKMLTDILQSSLYKKEYELLKSFSVMTFDNTVEALTHCANKSDTNKYVRKIRCMISNQTISTQTGNDQTDKQSVKPPFKGNKFLMEFTEQKTLISIINERKKAKGAKKLTLSDTAMDSLREEFNSRMKKIIPNYTPKGVVKFKELLYSIYIVINKNISSRKPELTELILDVKDIPFE